MSFSPHRKLTAWLGLLAIWLGVVMPLVSQNLRQTDFAALPFSICSSSETPFAHTGDLPAYDTAQAHHGLDACAYCGLLAKYLPVPHVIAGLGGAPLQFSQHLPVRTYAPEFAGTFPASQPRAPPQAFS